MKIEKASHAPDDDPLLHQIGSGCSPWLLLTATTKPFESSAHAAPIGENKESMNKKSEAIDDDDPLDHEIDFSNARPNPFARDYGRNRNLRILDPDLLKVFPDSDSVNEALHTLVRLASASAAIPLKRSARTAVAPKPKKKARVKEAIRRKISARTASAPKKHKKARA